MLLVTAVMLVIMVTKTVTFIMKVVVAVAVTMIVKSHNATVVSADPVGIAVLQVISNLDYRLATAVESISA
jgi:hypothetical protein